MDELTTSIEIHPTLKRNFSTTTGPPKIIKKDVG